MVVRGQRDVFRPCPREVAAAAAALPVLEADLRGGPGRERAQCIEAGQPTAAVMRTRTSFVM